MKKAVVLFAALALLVVAQVAPGTPPVLAQGTNITGNELVRYLGPNPVNQYGCNEYQTMVPFHISGLNTANEYRIDVYFQTVVGFTPTNFHYMSVAQYPGSAEFNFWAVGFDPRPYSGMPGVVSVAGANWPMAIPGGFFEQGSLTVYIYDHDTSELLSYSDLDIYNCSTGGFAALNEVP